MKRHSFRGNCAFPQNFHTRKLHEITVFYAVKRVTQVTYVEEDFTQKMLSGTDWANSFNNAENKKEFSETSIYLFPNKWV